MTDKKDQAPTLLFRVSFYSNGAVEVDATVKKEAVPYTMRVIAAAIENDKITLDPTDLDAAPE